MKSILSVGFISTGVLLSLCGTTGVAYAQREQREKERPPQSQPENQEQGRPERPQRAQRQQEQQRPPEQQQPQRAQRQQEQQRPQEQQQPQRAQQQQQQQGRPELQRPQRVQQQQAWSPQERGTYSVPQRTQQQARGWQQQRGWLQQGGWQGSDSWRQDRARRWQVEHRTWDQRGGYGGYYIPEDRFALNFGSRHWFRINSRPIIVRGYPRFQYGGFWFMLVDPWPEGWADDWYDTDDVYVDYYDGYYLHNRRDPGYAIAITIVL